MDTFKLKQLDLYKWIYESEFKRKEEFDRLLSFPVTVVSIFIGAMYFIINQYIIRIKAGLIFYDYLFLIFSALFYLFVALTIYYLVRVFYSYRETYKYLPFPSIMDTYQKELIEAYEKVEIGDDEKEKSLTTDFQITLIEWYSECSTKNALLNDLRSKYFNKTRLFTVVCAVIFIITSVLGLIKIASTKVPDEKKQSVEVKVLLQNAGQNIKVDTTAIVGTPQKAQKKK